LPPVSTRLKAFAAGADASRKSGYAPEALGAGAGSAPQAPTAEGVVSDAARGGVRGYLQSIGAPAFQDPNVAPMIEQALPGISGMPQPFRQGVYGVITKPTPAAQGMTPQANAGPPIDMSKPLVMRGGPRKIALDAGQPVGYDEMGRAVDTKGKKLGYLQEARPGRTLERNRGDVNQGASDRFGMGKLADDYTKLEKQYKTEFEDFKANGYRWPSGYFDNVNDKDAKATKIAVQQMRDISTDIDPKTKRPMAY